MISIVPHQVWAQNTDRYIGGVKRLFKVDQVAIKGVRKIEPEAILEKIKIKPGKFVTNYMIRDDIKRIYRMKYFENVEVMQETKKGKQILVFKLSEKPIVRKIRIEGNNEESDEDVFEQIKTKQYSIVDVNTLKSDAGNIQKFYEEKGYFLAKVDYEIKNIDKENLEIIFNIKEYDKVKVKKISFLGNKEIPDSELKAFMLTREDSLMAGMSEMGSFREFNFQADLERLSYYYRTKGYLQVNLANPLVTVSEDKRWIYITMQITEGPQYTVNNITFNGDLLFTEKQFLEKVTLRADEIYSEEKLRRDIQKLTEMYQDKGYAFVNVLRTLEPVPGVNRVDVNFNFEKGEIAYFGEVRVRGNEKTRDKVVLRELRFEEGGKYSGTNLRISKENVERLGFFEKGSVIFNTVSPPGKPNVLDVEVSVKERQTGQITVGAGYSSAQRGFLQASISQNNFRGLGQTLRFNLQLSDIQQNYELGLTEPFLFDSLWSLGGTVFRREATLPDIQNRDEGFRLRVGYPIFEYTRFFLSYNLQETEIIQTTDPLVDVNVENGIASGVSASVQYDKRNNIFEPTKGFFANTSLEYVGLGFDMRWLESQVDLRGYYPIIGDLILRSRLRVRQIFETDEDREIPRYARYFMGGPKTVRGFAIQGIGPQETRRDDFNNDGVEEDRVFNVRGFQSVLGTVEFEHPLVREAGLKWAIFYDAGNVFREHIGKNNDYRMRHSYGFGFRWFSPIGVLRFEMAYPINKRDDEAANQFHFDIGQIF